LVVIQTKANHNSVWDYIKPTLKKDEVRPELYKPSPPVVAMFNSATPNATLQSLNSEQLRRYKMAYKIYKDELKDWERRQTTINNIDDYIMRTTGVYWFIIERV
jgi:predicted oxidoreductase (fatty acid repression mutant protein)